MGMIADLHVHSRFSRGTSNSLNIDNLEKYALIKGVDLLGTGDFTHPEWIKELKQKLEEDGTGILRTKNGYPFMLQTEISLIYSQGGAGRKVHMVVLAKDFGIVDQITSALKKRGRVDYDGRPIFGIPCPEFVEMMKGIDRSIELIPAHVWTPWFSLFGSRSGFNSVKECFQDQTKHIHALETGLSSDPEMNWRLSQLDPYALVSFSDLHSYWPWRIGREATVFDTKPSYDSIMKAIRTKKGLKETIEVDPGYGKYHYTGHRNCNVCLDPKKSLDSEGICPKCGGKLTVGVLERVEELADRPPGYRPKDAKPFRKLIPLSEIIAHILGKSIATQAVWKEYNNLINNLGSELSVLLEAGKDELMRFTGQRIADAVMKNREGKIRIKPGYDGEYGAPLFNEGRHKPFSGPVKGFKGQKQTSLGEF
ncbi:MAG: endonuclease Q family protein [Candidatus Woesearchaeota archaeon]